MILIVCAAITLIVSLSAFFFGVSYGFNKSVEIYEQEHRTIMIDQAQCRVKDEHIDHIVHIPASFASVQRLDSTGAETIITLNHN